MHRRHTSQRPPTTGRASVVRTVAATPLRETSRVHKQVTDTQATVGHMNREPKLFQFENSRKGRHGYDRKVDMPTVFYSPSKTEEYRRLQRLGDGGFSVCYLFKMPNGSVAAGKIFSRGKGCSQKRLVRFEREVKLMQQLDHPNIVHYINSLSGVYQNKTLDDFGKEDTVPFIHPPIMFMQYCGGGSLSNLLKNRLDRRRFPDHKYGQLSESETLWVAESTARALEYIQRYNIIHRDIKLGNLLLQSSVHRDMYKERIGVVLCDFGLASQLQQGEMTVHGNVGTPSYMPPELVIESEACFGSDMWCLGVTLFHCLTGRPPFRAKEVSGIYRRVKEGNYRWHTVEKSNIDPDIRHLVDSMLSQDPKKRPSPSLVIETVQKLHQ